MSIRRFTMALVSAVMLSSLSIGLTLAEGPAPAREPEPELEPEVEERPLTPEEEAQAEAKIAAAEQYLASPAAEQESYSSLACITPNGSSAAGESTQASCTTPYKVLAVEARDQIRGHYCGPAVGQVIANYSWAMASGKNKYSQTTIAGWMKTDTYGSTDAPRLEDGLERATASSPRKPANWNWVVMRLQDTDGDGLFGDQLHGYVRSNVSGSKMPLAIPVKPHDRNSRYRLSSWPRPVSSVGHWIAAYGWYAYWSNTDTPQIAYTDSSRDEGGSTGKFWDPTRHLAAMIMEHTQRIVW
jgi:hypothetical protein